MMFRMELFRWPCWPRSSRWEGDNSASNLRNIKHAPVIPENFPFLLGEVAVLHQPGLWDQSGAMVQKHRLAVRAFDVDQDRRGENRLNHREYW
jgi:hypothetical protein